ncbi:MAG TPA: thioredoxin family protein [Calditrichaeota bacterium]|nr:thioredoxin family protein [Calditrichota bacterium]
MIRLVLSSLLLFFLLAGCGGQKKEQKLTSKKVVLDNIEMLYGQITKEQLYFDYPEWLITEKEYMPDSSIITKLQELPGKYTVEIFFGTWCGDSEREVPHFFKIHERARLKNKLSYKLYAVNRKLKLDNDLTEKRKIERVATFIFYKDGNEVGRIVETPNDLLENDILQILSKGK